MQELTPELLAQIYQVPVALITEIFPDMIETMRDFGITDPNSITCYFVQTCWESTGLQNFVELGPVSYFDKYDPTGPDPTLAAALGNTNPGDGYAFRGSGPIQLTGKNNFYNAQVALDAKGVKGPDGSPLDLTTVPSVYDTAGNCLRGPDLARTHAYGFSTSAWWWQAHMGNEVAQRQPLSYASLCCGRMVNEGDPDSPYPAQGEQGRIDCFNRIAGFGQLSLPSITPPAPPTPPEDIVTPEDRTLIAQEVVKELLATPGERISVDIHGKETIVVTTFKDAVFGGATTVAARMAASVNYIKGQVRKIR